MTSNFRSPLRTEYSTLIDLSKVQLDAQARLRRHMNIAVFINLNRVLDACIVKFAWLHFFEEVAVPACPGHMKVGELAHGEAPTVVPSLRSE